MIIRKGMKLYGSMVYTNEFPDVICALQEGRVQTSSLISNHLTLEDLESGLIDFYATNRMKMMLEV